MGNHLRQRLVSDLVFTELYHLAFQIDGVVINVAHWIAGSDDIPLDQIERQNLPPVEMSIVGQGHRPRRFGLHGPAQGFFKYQILGLVAWCFNVRDIAA